MMMFGNQIIIRDPQLSKVVSSFNVEDVSLDLFNEIKSIFEIFSFASLACSQLNQ